jgi:hypothetical protein
MRTVFSNLILLTITALICQLTACKKDYSFEGSKIPTGPTITDSTLYIDVTINGVRYLRTFNGGVGGISYWGRTDVRTYNTQINKYCFLGSLTSGLGNVSDTPSWYSDSLPQFYFTKNVEGLNKKLRSTNNTNVYSFTADLTDSLFPIGYCNYAINTGIDTTFTPYYIYGNGSLLTRKLLNSGVLLTWIDSTGTVWQTSNGNTDQAGSNFTIIKNDYQKGFDPVFNAYDGTIITANFDCMLYNDKGDSIHLTNGSLQAVYSL